MMTSERMQGRVNNIVAALRKFQNKIDSYPNHENVSMWEGRVESYRQNLKNIKDFGMATKPAALEGIKIDIPEELLK